MKVELSKDTHNFIIEQLDGDDIECTWELSKLPPQHKRDNTNTYIYWVAKQAAIRKALKELRI